MDTLPEHLIVNILSRLNDSTELTRCKCVSKTLNSLAHQVRSINLHRFNKNHSPEARSEVTPFTTIFNKLISDAQVPIESVSIGVEDAFDCFSDLWMSTVGHGLKSISISSFSYQWIRKKTNILDVISLHCHSLFELKLEDAKLSVTGMHMMPLLTRLTLNDVVIYDESLNKLMECLPCLQVLNVISVFCAYKNQNPKIHHLNLKYLKWTISEWIESFIPRSHTIFAPNLNILELETDYPLTLSIHAPLLSYCNLALSFTDKLNVDRFKYLKTLSLASSEIYDILLTFPSSTTVDTLTLLVPTIRAPIGYESVEFSLHNVFTNFPNITSLTLDSHVWSQKILYPSAALVKDSTAINNMKGLKQITLYLVHGNIDKALSFILYVVGICTNLSDIVLFIHRKVDLGVAISFVSSCMSQCPKVRFRWGTWKEGSKDVHLK